MLKADLQIQKGRKTPDVLKGKKIPVVLRFGKVREIQVQDNILHRETALQEEAILRPAAVLVHQEAQPQDHQAAQAVVVAEAEAVEAVIQEEEQGKTL